MKHVKETYFGIEIKNENIKRIVDTILYFWEQTSSLLSTFWMMVTAMLVYHYLTVNITDKVVLIFSAICSLMFIARLFGMTEYSIKKQE